MEEQPLEQTGEEVTPTVGEGEVSEQEAKEAQQTIPQEEQSVAKTFTQEELNKIIKERLERHSKSIYSKYGVDNDDGFDEIYTRAEAYAEMKERYDSVNSERESLRNELAIYRENEILSNAEIAKDRYDDVKTWFKGKGEKITEGTLKDALASHPEWVKKAEKKTTILPIGNEQQPPKATSEDEIAKKIFGLDHFVD